MPDQAASLRQLVGGPQRFAKVVTFASGKGGVGKSNLITALSILLADRGHKVALMDMDLGLANLDLLLGVKPRFNLAHVMAGQKKITEIVCPGPNNIMFVPGASGVSRLANLNRKERDTLVERFSELESISDLLLIDTGAGLGENVLHFATASQSLIVVTNPEPPARMDAYALIKTALTRSPNLPVFVLVNEVRHESEARNVYRSISEVSRQHLPQAPHFLGYVPRDDHVVRAVSRRIPFVLEYPSCAASRAMSQVSRDFERNLLPHRGGPDDRQRSSFFTRLFSAFSSKSA